jgi:hypothetical protein
VFVDTDAWIALALTKDPLHPRAAAAWAELLGTGPTLSHVGAGRDQNLCVSGRNTNRQVALTWKESW